MPKALAATTLLVLLPLVGCAPAGPFATLPRDATIGVGDPTRAAVIGNAYAFATTDVMAGHPEAAARAAAQVEYLASEIPAGPRWVDFNPTVGLALVDARAELRSALGVAPNAPPQAVVDGFYAASRALVRGDQAAARQALAAPDFPDAPTTLQRLAGMPALPRTRSATALTERELFRTDQDNQHSSGGGGAMF